MKQPTPQPLPLGAKDIGNNQVERIASEDQLNADIATHLTKSVDRLSDATISLAIRAKESREFLDWHTEHVRKSWLDWIDESAKVMESIRQTRVAIGIESKKLLEECGDVRKFFLADDHAKEIARLRDFIELCERLKALKADGTL